MPMNPRLLRPRALQGVPTYLARLGMKFLALNNNGSFIAASATANTPGTWVQVFLNNSIAASDSICCLHVQAIGNNQVTGTDNSMLLDIGTGAAGAEVVVADGIAVGGGSNSAGFGPAFNLPIRIPGATRVAVRTRSAVGGRILVLQNLWASGRIANDVFADQLPLTVDVLGTTAATSTGTPMSGANGSWTQITASTTKEYQALVLVPSGPASISGAAATNFVLTLGTGAAGQEVELAYSSGFYNSTGSIFPYQLPSVGSVYGGLIPVGTRIAVRHNQAANPERLCACVIGVPFA